MVQTSTPLIIVVVTLQVILLRVFTTVVHLIIGPEIDLTRFNFQEGVVGPCHLSREIDNHLESVPNVVQLDSQCCRISVKGSCRINTEMVFSVLLEVVLVFWQRLVMIPPMLCSVERGHGSRYRM